MKFTLICDGSCTKASKAKMFLSEVQKELPELMVEYLEYNKDLPIVQKHAIQILPCFVLNDEKVLIDIPSIIELKKAVKLLAQATS